MFRFLGNAVSRFWPLVLGAWGLLLALSWASAPDWNAVTESGEVAFLPPDSPSRRSEQLFRDAFPDQYAASNIVLIAAREGAELQDQTHMDGEDVTDTLNSLMSAGFVESLPYYDEVQLAEMLINELSEEKFDPLQFHDDYRERLMARIKAKAQGKPIAAAEKKEEKGGEVVDIMEALRRSLEGGR